ncbi:MAG: DNA gyrase inhibitor YacG [Betaproteobacteria bacterium]|nr:DNA gyrase inhibitor YacG [Betaproteobacteria bacterium]
MSPAALMVACPQCNKQTPWQTENPWRPFCCERCKLLDLGNWAEERYRLPEENTAETHPSTPGETV